MSEWVGTGDDKPKVPKPQNELGKRKWFPRKKRGREEKKKD